MAKKPESKKTAAKKPITKRVGANQLKVMEAQRAQRPLVIMRAAKRISIIVAIAVLATAVGFAVFAYAPTVSAKISETSKTSKRLSGNVKITSCGAYMQKHIKSVIDSLMGNDLHFDRADIMKTVAKIPEIEKINIKKIKDKTSKEKVTHIKVTERKPVALVHCGSVSLVDKKGIRFMTNQGRYYDLPFLIIGEHALRDTIDMEIFNAVKKVSKDLGGAFFQQISQIDISDSTAVSLFFKSGETEYVIGCDDIKTRLPHVKKLRERLMDSHGEPARIDMRYRSLAFASSQ